MVVAALGRGAGREARLGQGAGWPGGGEPEGAGGVLPRRAARYSGRGPQVAGELCLRSRGRRRDRLAPFPPGRAPARGRGPPQTLRRHLPAVRVPGPRRPAANDPPCPRPPPPRTLPTPP